MGLIRSLPNPLGLPPAAAIVMDACARPCSGQIARARAWRALALQSPQPERMLLRASACYAAAGKHHCSFFCARRARRLRPGLPEASMAEARALSAMGLPGPSAEAARLGFEANPRCPWLALFAAGQFLAAGMPARAAGLFLQALAQCPRHPACEFGLAVCWRDGPGPFRRACSLALLRSLSERPGAGAWSGRARLLLLPAEPPPPSLC